MDKKITIEITAKDSLDFVRALGDMQSFLIDINNSFNQLGSNSGTVVCNKIREKQKDINGYLQVLKYFISEINNNEEYQQSLTQQSSALARPQSHVVSNNPSNEREVSVDSKKQLFNTDDFKGLYQEIKKQLTADPEFQQLLQDMISTSQSIKALETRTTELSQKIMAQGKFHSDKKTLANEVVSADSGERTLQDFYSNSTRQSGTKDTTTYEMLNKSKVDPPHLPDEGQLPPSMQQFVDKYNTTNYRHTKLKLVKEMEDIRAVTRQRYQSDEDSKKVRLIETTGQSPYYCEAIEGEMNFYYVVPIKNIRFSEDTVCQNAYEDFFFFDTNNDLDADMGRYVLEKPAILKKCKTNPIKW